MKKMKLNFYSLILLSVFSLITQQVNASAVTTLSQTSNTNIPISNFSKIYNYLYNSSQASLTNLVGGGYVEYTVSSATQARYALNLSGATMTGSTMNVLVNGVSQAIATLSKTASWTTYVNEPSVFITLPIGSSVIRIAGANGTSNLNKISFSNPSFDLNNLSSSATTIIPLGSFSAISGFGYSMAQGALLNSTPQGNNGYIEYSVDSPSSQKYAIELNGATLTTGAKLALEVNGVTQGTVALNKTSTSTSYIAQPVVDLSLPLGKSTLRIQLASGTANLDKISFAPVTTPTATIKNYYVSGTGNDSTNNGLSPTSPFLTPQKAIDLVTAGGTVFLMNGTYKNSDYSAARPAAYVMDIKNKATASEPITITAYSGATPKVEFNSPGGIVVEGGASYINITGFEVQGYSESINLSYALANSGDHNNPFLTENCIAIEGYQTYPTIPTHITVSKMNVHDCSLDGIGTNTADYITIQDNIVTRCAHWSPYAGSGISIYHSYDSDTNTTSYKNIVQRNISYSNQEFIGNFNASGYISDGNGIIIDDNEHTQDTKVPYKGKTLVENNLVYENGGTGMHAYYSQHVDFINNTAYLNNQTPGITSGQILAGNSNYVTFYNNISVAPSGKPTNTDYENTNITVDYNLNYGGTGPEISGSHDITGKDPLFIAPSSGNFKLNTGSPALESALATMAPKTDLLKNVRPGTDGGYDRGAYQK